LGRGEFAFSFASATFGEDMKQTAREVGLEGPRSEEPLRGRETCSVEFGAAVCGCAVLQVTSVGTIMSGMDGYTATLYSSKVWVK
jgi:hypothetical protein